MINETSHPCGAEIVVARQRWRATATTEGPLWRGFLLERVGDDMRPFRADDTGAPTARRVGPVRLHVRLSHRTARIIFDSSSAHFNSKQRNMIAAFISRL